MSQPHPKSYQILKSLYQAKEQHILQKIPILIFNKFRQIYNKYKYFMAEHPDHFKVVSIAKAKPGHIKDLEPLIHEITEKSRKEPGTLKIDVYKVREQEGVYVWLEQYKTEADFTAHKASEHFKDIIIRSTPFLLEPPTILSLEKEKI